MALAVGIFASCSSDDFAQNNDNAEYNLANDGTELFVTVGQEGGSTTRAGYANAYDPSDNTILQQFLWAENDVFKVYCKDTWKPQNYKFTKYATISGANGSVFTWADEDSKYNKGDDAADMTNREYAIFPGYEPTTDAGVAQMKFANEYRTALELTIPAVNAYTVSAMAAGTPFDKNGTEKTLAQNRMYVANTLIPLFGFVDAENNKVSFQYTTALLLVNLQGLEPGQYKVILTSAANKLSGVFNSTGFDAAEYDAEDIPTFATSTSTADDKSIAATFTADGTLGTEYFIYLPIVTGEYDANDLTVTLKKKGASDYEDYNGMTISFNGLVKSTPKASLEFDGSTPVTLENGDFVKVLAKSSSKANAASLAELQTIFNTFNKLTRATEFDVTVANTGIKVADDTHLAQYYTLNVPTDQAADVTVNLVGDDGNPTPSEYYGYFAAGDGSGDKILKLTGGVVGKKVAIKTNAENKVAFDLSEFKGDLIFNGSTVTTTGNLTLPKTGNFALLGGEIGGTIATVEGTTGNIQLTPAAVTGTTTIATTGNVTLDGVFGGAVVVNATSGKLNVTGTFNDDLTLGAEDSKIVGEINLNPTALADNKAVKVYTTNDVEISGTAFKGTDRTLSVVSDKNITLKEGGNTQLATFKGANVTVEKGSTNSGKFNATATDNITLNGKFGNAISTYGTAKVTIGENINAGGSINIRSTGDVTIAGKVGTVNNYNAENVAISNDVTKLTEELTGNISITAGKVTTIVVAEKKTATINTFGASEINEVTLNGTGDDKAVANIAATWDAETQKAGDYGKTEDTDYVTIYTAAQLAKLSGETWSTDNLRLKADITVADDATANWIPVTWNGGTFDGNSKTITGLKIKPTATSQVGFFKTIKGETTVKDLTLAGLTFDGTATQQIGGLVGNINATNVTIQKVSVRGKKLYGTDEAYTIGGLIGRAQAGTIAITNSKVEFEEIAGKQYVGGLIGDNYTTGTAASITLTQNEGQTMVTLSKLTRTGTAGAKHKATFGMLMGAIRVAATITIVKEAGDIYNANLIDGARDSYEYDKKTYEQDGATFMFTGYNGNFVGFCPAYDYTSDSAKKNNNTGVTINGDDLKWNQLNKFVLESAWVK